ncbi:glycogen synthase GlgA [Acidiphilium sp. AL]|uniref:Glycogen synthase n=1 Tax=Acidiphilium iwatense TaxID=768198 RepID=A0ABS9DRN6_9PROT|nr:MULTISPECIES: glycogen synthase GlgA [Acidiphilium]MCF3945377.1 glycogen synthase GlgA [Acidiphilium iwatense]MCU4158893.1 glycogen synthase GlgA [Acidiphilium sp. AL]
MKVLSVGSELYPLVKTGGLADVMGALPAALAPEGIAMRALIPGYPSVLAGLTKTQPALDIPALFGGDARIISAESQGLPLFVLDAPHLFARPGNPYLGPDGMDWPDNAQRFAALCRAAAMIAQGTVAGFAPDVVHAHDWQAGLLPAYLRFGERPAPPTVMTVHNLAYQGQFPAYLLGTLGLPARAFTIDGVEHYGAIGFLKAGMQLADAITTVSPSYAAEIATPEGGMGLDGLIRARASAMHGILNGLDTAVWNPATDAALAVQFTSRTLAGRAANKQALQARMGLDQDKAVLLFGLVSRLASQKGIDLVIETLPVIDALGAQLVVLGAGDPSIERALRAAVVMRPGRVAATIGFEEALAHLIQSGADAILVPSRFEPCGLTQLSAQRYGAIPVVARVGGLADTVIDANEVGLTAGVATGVQFAPVAADALALGLRRTAALFADKPAWRRMQRNAMALDVSWTQPARRYAALYRSLVN